MCNHKRIVIIPSEENSWGIADTYHIKCTCCDKTLYENVLSSKIKEYEAMTMEELQKELKELKKELFKLRFSHALNGLDNPKKITLVKKNIARVNTVITKKSNN